MKRLSLKLSVIVGIGLTAGCNRQDADALSKLGQKLVERAKALPIATPHSKAPVSQPASTDTVGAPAKEEN